MLGRFGRRGKNDADDDVDDDEDGNEGDKKKGVKKKKGSSDASDDSDVDEEKGNRKNKGKNRGGKQKGKKKDSKKKNADGALHGRMDPLKALTDGLHRFVPSEKDVKGKPIHISEASGYVRVDFGDGTGPMGVQEVSNC